MQCPKCGWNNPDDVVNCGNCAAELRPQPPQQPYAQQPYDQQQYRPGPMPAVPDYLAWSIVATAVSMLLGAKCCISLAATGLGIVAIVKSAQANCRKSFRDYAGAMADADAARTWLYWAVGVWAVSVVVTIIAVIAYVGFILFVMSQQMRFQP